MDSRREFFGGGGGKPVVLCVVLWYVRGCRRGLLEDEVAFHQSTYLLHPHRHSRIFIFLRLESTVAFSLSLTLSVLPHSHIQLRRVHCYRKTYIRMVIIYVHSILYFIEGPVVYIQYEYMYKCVCTRTIVFLNREARDGCNYESYEKKKHLCSQNETYRYFPTITIRSTYVEIRINIILRYMLYYSSWSLKY
jgi:hypothetical protein